MLLALMEEEDAMAHRAGTLEASRLALLQRLVRRMDAHGQVTDEVRRVVDLLTSVAAPDRADRLAVGTGEAPALVERLAAWALHRTSDQAVAHATQILDGGEPSPAAAQASHRPAPAFSPYSRPAPLISR